jgi:hypothetical protein
MTRLDELMMEWEACRERGEVATPESLCPDDTELRTSLAARIRLVEKFNNYFLDSEDDLPGPEPAPLPRPETVGKFQIVGELGTGGMGVVYEGWDPDLSRPVAVKMIRPDRLTIGPAEAAARFKSEGRALASFTHPNIVGVYQAGTHGDSPYLVMEYVPGGTIGAARARIASQGPRAVAALVEKVARAVHAAHEQTPPIFHRDLKPTNILLTAKGEPKVADFGLARLLDPAVVTPPAVVAAPVPVARGETAASSSLGTIGGGTPGYMAPEQTDPYLARVTAATDVWALGVILHELLTGERPSSREVPNPKLVQTTVRGRAGKRLAAIVERCLRPKPQDRYASAGELADALAREIARPRRERILAGAAAVVLVAASVAFAVNIDREALRYRSRVAEIQTKLDAGETVAIVGEGAPLPRYRVHGDTLLTRVQWRNDALHVASDGYCSLIELFSARPGAHLRIEAVVEVTRPTSGKNSWGVFVDHNPERHDAGRGYQFDVAGFQEHLNQRKSSESFLGEYHYRAPAGRDPGINRLFQWREMNPNPHRDFVVRREVLVDVRHNAVTARCGFSGRSDGPVDFGPLTNDDRGFNRKRLLDDGIVTEPLTGGSSVRIGLFAQHTEITVHSFSVRQISSGEE